MASSLSDALEFENVGTSLSDRQRLQNLGSDIALGLHVLGLRIERTDGSAAARVGVALFDAASGGVPIVYTSDSSGNLLLLEQNAAGVYFGAPGVYFPNGCWAALIVDAGSTDDFELRVQYQQS